MNSWTGYEIGPWDDEPIDWFSLTVIALVMVVLCVIGLVNS